MELSSLVLAESWVAPLAEAAARHYLYTVIGGVFVVGIVFNSVKAMVAMSAREKSRREIAAYIAEGSMTPGQGERLMRAKEPCQE